MLSMKTLVQEFLFDCQVRNLSPRTIHNYEKPPEPMLGGIFRARGGERGDLALVRKPHSFL